MTAKLVNSHPAVNMRLSMVSVFKAQRMLVSATVAQWRKLLHSMLDEELKRGAAFYRADSPAAEIALIIEAFRRRITTPDYSATAEAIFDIGEGEHRRKWRRLIQEAYGIALVEAEPWIPRAKELFVVNNVSLIRGLGNDLAKDVENIVMSGFAAGERAETIMKEIYGLQGSSFSKSKNRAKLIARDQLSKLYGQIDKRRQEDAGVTQYDFITSVDERVRKNHATMHRKRCRWDNADVFTRDNGKTWILRSSIGGVGKHPGQDIQCRCTASAVLPEFYGQPEVVKGEAEKVEGEGIEWGAGGEVKWRG